jgi:hypothetical protein
MTEITFDFDDENVDRFVPVLTKLHERYGDAVLVRRSSSRGWHIWVKGTNVSPEEELKLRDELGDCEGRRAGDYARLHGGLTTSRLFTAKGRIYKGQRVVRRSGDWMTFEEWRERFVCESTVQEKER